MIMQMQVRIYGKYKFPVLHDPVFCQSDIESALHRLSPPVASIVSVSEIF